MINLGRCLVYLLSRNDRVALRGLGVFRRIDKPGYFDTVNQVFVAPESQIEFSPDSKKSEFDELIPEYIAAQKQMGSEEAEILYADALAKWMTLLSQEGSIELQGIGVLQQQGEENLSLSPNRRAALERNCHRWKSFQYWNRK